MPMIMMEMMMKMMMMKINYDKDKDQHHHLCTCSDQGLPLVLCSTELAYAAMQYAVLSQHAPTRCAVLNELCGTEPACSYSMRGTERAYAAMQLA
eukprot:996658-Rhodomonas_salina.1